ncbi:MAG: F0F1 ATP synthase subunit epsilon [Paramuribaculum sp.]|nr:F0F1 ATP synthase subunit epsilon [Paramuribaculum sp.]MDE6651136.1 F0F1 ATP synthase subunit epsilon [Paramuribaculum sp.]
MTLKIISAEDVVFEGEVSSVTLPGQMGEFTVLKNHASLVSVLTPGKITYAEDGELQSVDIQGGLVDVDNNIISVCLC